MKKKNNIDSIDSLGYVILATLAIAFILYAIISNQNIAYGITCTSDADVQARQKLVARSTNLYNAQKREVDRLEEHNYPQAQIDDARAKLDDLEEGLEEDKEVLADCKAQVEDIEEEQQENEPVNTQEEPEEEEVIEPTPILIIPPTPPASYNATQPITRPIVESKNLPTPAKFLQSSESNESTESTEILTPIYPHCNLYYSPTLWEKIRFWWYNI